MNKLSKMLCAVFTLLLVNGVTAQADSSNFAGPYLGVQASGYGIQMEGNSTSVECQDTCGTESDDVSLGQVAPISGIELGYALPLGSMFLLDIGGSFYSGEAKISSFNDNNGEIGAEASFKIDGLTTGYIAPTLVMTDTSSLYLKVGISEAQVKVTGDITGPADLNGRTYAIGTRTVLPSGIFIRTEAGYTEYNGISAHGKGTNIAATTSFSAEPTVAFGAVSLGFRF